MAKEYNQEKIENFVRGFMEESERQQFQEEMRMNEDLQTEVDFYQDVASIVRKRKMLQNVQSELMAADFFKDAAAESESQGARVVKMPQRGFRSVRRYLAYAASLALLVIAGFWFANSNYSNNSLAALDTSDLASVRLDSGLKGDDDQAVDVFAQGIEAIKAQDYPAAATFFERLVNEEAYRENALLHLAYVQYEMKDYAAAIESAETLIEEKPRLAQLRFDAEWLFVKSKLAAGELDEAFEQQLASIVSNDNHQQQEAAQVLQNKLNSFWRSLIF